MTVELVELIEDERTLECLRDARATPAATGPR